MTTKDESTGQGGRLVTRNNWIICSIVAFVVALQSVGRQGYSILHNPAYFVGSFIGTLLLILLFVVVVRGLYRIFTNFTHSR